MMWQEHSIYRQLIRVGTNIYYDTGNKNKMTRNECSMKNNNKEGLKLDMEVPGKAKIFQVRYDVFYI